jgi:F-type H+-transporting ATPase subunit epsilon
MSIELIVVTPEGQAYEGSIQQVVLPGSEGDFGVLEQHERYLAPLRSGKMEIIGAGGSTFAAISSGFADVSGEQVVVLVDRCQTADQIDVEDARARQQEARVALDRLTLDEEAQAQRPALESALAHATAELEVAGQ